MMGNDISFRLISSQACLHSSDHVSVVFGFLSWWNKGAAILEYAGINDER